MKKFENFVFVNSKNLAFKNLSIAQLPLNFVYLLLNVDILKVVEGSLSTQNV